MKEKRTEFPIEMLLSNDHCLDDNQNKMTRFTVWHVEH